MLRSLTLAALLLVVPSLASAQELKGVWLGISQVTINGPGDVEVVDFNAPRYLIYTDAFFNYTFPPEGPQPSGELTNAQIVERATSYASVGGTYMRDGTRILYNRRVSLNPNASQAANQPQIREIRVLTANRLVTQATNPDGTTVLLVYDRIE